MLYGESGGLMSPLACRLGSKIGHCCFATENMPAFTPWLRGFGAGLLGLGLFAAGYALPPLYDHLTAHAPRTAPITIRFTASEGGGVSIRPSQAHINLPALGEPASVHYTLTNNTDQRINGQAVPVYAPDAAAPWFHKIQCFCFGPMSLEAGETKRFPVVFQIDPQLPEGVEDITLSYQFFPLAASK